jgi:8-oxo-dGTP pyrophosphatase MutT (NUDIX family)
VSYVPTVSPWIEQLVARLAPRAIHPPADGRRRAAVAIVLRDDGGPRVLLMERATRADDPWSGHISLPGGGHHERDADLAATAVRETREELGIDLSTARMLGDLSTLAPFTSGPAGMEVTPFVFLAPAVIELQLGPEAVSAFWLPLERARSGALDTEFRHPIRAIPFPAWTYDGHVIWGLTRRILEELLALTTP